MNGAEYVTQAPQVPPLVQGVFVLLVVFLPLALGLRRIWTSGGGR